MVAPSADLQLALNVIGVFVFALSGALVGVRRGLDMVGVVVLAGVAGLGGGMLRDILLGDLPPVSLGDGRLLGTALVAGLLIFVLHPRLTELRSSGRRLRLGLITRSVHSGRGRARCLLGRWCTQGGLVQRTPSGRHPDRGDRDLLAGQVPELLRRELYAVPALIGAVLVVVAFETGHLGAGIVWASVMLVFLIRMVAVILDLNAPTALETCHDLAAR